MRLLLDACVWGGASEELIAAGHDVVWAGEWPENPGDMEILARAYGEGRTLVTLDKDFGELAIVWGHPHRGIIRLVDVRARQQGGVCHHVLTLHSEELQSGAIVTVDTGRIRIRPSEMSEGENQ